MSKDTINVDPSKIKQRIIAYEAEIKRLHGLLDTLDTLREFTADEDEELPASDGRGRPKSNPLTDPLRAFVQQQAGEFTNVELKAVVGDAWRKDKFFYALKELEDEGLLVVVEKPVGRRAGRYKRGEESA